MIDVVEREGACNVLGLNVSGKLSGDDYHYVIPILNQMIEEHGKLRVVIDLNDFGGMSLHAIFDELKFDITHWSSFEKIAIIGDKSWLNQMSKLTDKLIRGHVKHYHEDQKEDAWTWASE